MKKILLLIVSLLLIQTGFAGGLLTNTNQSAQFIRMLSRNASVDIDAVYFNPAGLIKLNDGWHFSFYSQTIFQDKIIKSNFPLLNNGGNFKSSVQIPVSPTFFAVYKVKDLAFSLGFGHYGGDGLTEFNSGLPTFEIPVSKIVPRLEDLAQIDESWNVVGYGNDLLFTGSSYYWGIQFGITYKVSEFFSVSYGIRYLPSKNIYKGSIQNIRLKLAGQSEMVLASDWLIQTANKITDEKIPEADAAAVKYSEGASRLHDLIRGGVGGLTLEELEAEGYIKSEDREQVVDGLQILNYTLEEIDNMDVTVIRTNYLDGADYYESLAISILPAAANDLTETAGQVEDKNVDTKQTGASITPMIGINFSPLKDLNFALKYEMATLLYLRNKTEVDDLGIFPDGRKSNNSVPAMLGIGASYKVGNWLETQLSYNRYYDKGIDWGYNMRDAAIWIDKDITEIRKREIDHNMWELGLGLQFNLSDKFAISVGGLRSKSGIADSYQSDFSYSNPSSTIGAGFMWKIIDKLILDAGFANTFYEDQKVTFSDPDIGSYNEVLGKTTITFAVGLSYSIF